MPLYFQENNQPLPADNEHRSYQKWNDLLYQTFGNKGPNYFQEGSRPLPGDNKHRSLQKINAILSSLEDSVNLSTGLVAYWQLEEASGTRVDSTGRGNDLTPTNNPSNTTGKVGNAANFVAASDQKLSHADSADLQFNGDFTITCWLYLDSNAAEMAAISKWGFLPGEMDNFILTYDQTSDRFRVYLGDGQGHGFVLVYSDTFGAPIVGQWHFVAIWRDGNNLYISVNNGSPDSVDASSQSTTFVGAADFQISNVENGSAIPWDGRVDQVRKYNRAINATERSRLYNSGSGM